MLVKFAYFPVWYDMVFIVLHIFKIALLHCLATSRYFLLLSSDQFVYPPPLGLKIQKSSDTMWVVSTVPILLGARFFDNGT